MKRLINVILITAMLVLLGFGFRELGIFISAERMNESLREEVVKVPKVDEGEEKYLDPNDPFNRYIDFKTLKGINEDIVGWIYIPDSLIDYPILRGSSDQKYLYKDYTGKYSVIGSIFMFSDAELGTDDHVIFFGHNMISKQMFGGLKDYKSADYASTHMKAYIYTPDRTKECDLISTFRCYKMDEVFELNVSDEEKKSVSEWHNSLNERSIYPLSIPNTAGQIFTLSTCDGYTGTSNRLTVNFAVTKEKYILN